MRAQVSFFIIIGVLAVIAVVSGILIFSTPTPTPVSPSESSPDFILLRSCVDTEFIDTIVLAGLNGGILEMSSDQRHERAYFEPIRGYEFPLWNKNNNFYYHTSQSALEAQVANELQKRINERCVVESGISSETTSSVSVTLSQRTNTADVSFNGEFLSDNSVTSIPNIRVDNNLPLLSNFNRAVGIADELLLSGVLVGMNHNIIELSTDIPTSGMDFSCNTKQWRKSEVQANFMQSLETYVPYIRFDNTPSVSSDIAEKHFTFSVPGVTNDINVRAIYQSSYGMFFEAEKSQGDLMTSLVTSNPETPNICQNQYSFWYTMQYPLIFSIEDRSSGEPFVFRMALYNEVFRNQLETRPDNLFSASGYCSDTTFRRAKITLQDEQAQSILNAFARIKCGNEECVLRADSEGVINDYLPRRCIRGTITFEKMGYKTVTTDYVSNQFDSLSTTPITMPSLRSFDLEFTGSHDLTNFWFMLESGSTRISFDDNNAMVPRDLDNIKFVIYQFTQDNNFRPVFDKVIDEPYSDMSIIINTEYLTQGPHSALGLVNIQVVS